MTWPAGPRAGDARDDGVPPDIEELDPGLAGERTSMAWTRTAISFAATGAAILKTHLLPGLVVLALGVATWLLTRFFPGITDDASRHRRLLLVTCAVTSVAVVSLVVVMTAKSAGR